MRTPLSQMQLHMHACMHALTTSVARFRTGCGPATDQGLGTPDRDEGIEGALIKFVDEGLLTL